MADQATITVVRNGHDAGPAKAITRNMSDLAGDITSLAELQGRLLVADAKESVQRMVFPLLLAVAGGAVFLGTVPVFLFWIAALIMLTGIGAAWSLFLACLVGVILGAIALAIAWYLLRDSLVSFDRSRKELAENIQWIKDALRESGRASHEAECT